ncbi:glyoxalase [Pseudomonas entomophila]|jgi:predicted enzyme related to lactoylglutathione lyase|uniref:VOC family protein n=1 Tax=Pseudomonas entomophila TaxID=312306 RepID=UPI0015E371BB|nr:VOC family protein [Pseudomonas entomophila]MBA1192131.1 glyoxalase [Pseudomonas entomophila]
MSHQHLILLYVRDPQASAAFYEQLLGTSTQSMFPHYVSFALNEGTALGLWSIAARDFRSGGRGHRGEVAFLVDTPEHVETLYRQWAEHGVRIEQPLHEAVFGLTFVALDLDGHRLRVCLPD